MKVHEASQAQVLQEGEKRQDFQNEKKKKAKAAGRN